ncbi:MAG: SLC13 family permease, partial [Firmicutes bacterium]|nr:SLC13 family permease [Bacillota bacterium]
GLVALFIESKMPSLLADKIIDWAPNVKWAIVGLAVFAGLISAFVDNVATVLMVAPIALHVCKKLKINPVPAIIAIAVFSNIEGAATLVGDTTSIMFGTYANLNFFDFFFTSGVAGGAVRFSIFWIVQAGLAAATLVLFVIFRKYKHPIKMLEKTVVTDYVPSILMIGVVVLLIIASFIPNAPELINGYICVGLMLIGIIWKMISKKKMTAIKETVKEIDFLTLLMLAGIFVIVAALIKVGIINWLGEALAAISGGNAFVAYTIILWGSVFLSAFIDNIPYVAMMLGVVTVIANNFNVNPSVYFINPMVFYFALISGATLGGNLTPIGASANIAGIGILRKAGFKVKTWD